MNSIIKSFVNVGKRAPLHFFRTNDKKEIDLLMERNGALFPIEVKKSASPAKSDARNFSALLPATADGVPAELAAFKRKVGMGTVICMSNDAFPLADNVWAFPSWAI